ncbi:MAG: hypothetical protein H0V18_09135 [Pyrinomonadaceae bacterium]|nr:hypothetical protein [Pyrinomonadaceae bacterium]
MPKPDKNLLPPKSPREELFDAILGPDEEMDDELADEILDSYNLTGPQLVEEFKLRLQAEIKSHLQATDEISKPLEAALKSIRDQQRASEPEPVRADSWIDGFLGGSIVAGAQPQLLYSFHRLRQGAATANDKKILDDLEAELGEE